MKHTPGPWVYEPKTACVVTSDGEAMVVQPEGLIFSDMKSEGEVDANGYLIAAAPDLLAALKGLLIVRVVDRFGAVRLAERAIAKAEGRDQ